MACFHPALGPGAPSSQCSDMICWQARQILSLPNRLLGQSRTALICAAPGFPPARSPCSTASLGTSSDSCMSKRPMVKIGTHSGAFHCDEALGCAMLRSTAAFKDADIVRSRDPEVLKDLDIIIDVGGVYDPQSHRYDHHQREFKDTFGNGFECTRLSSAGLVYRHFGREVISNILGIPVDHPDMEAIYLRVYKSFIEAVDAIDNGVNPWDTTEAPRYVNNTTLAARVGSLNLRWNEKGGDDAINARFQEAVQLTWKEFSDCVRYQYDCWLPGRAFVKQALEERLQVDPSGQIVRLPGVCPWKEHLYDLEKEMGITTPVLYVLYEDEWEKKWRIQCVSVGPGSFDNRRSMPAAWRGVRDDKLSEISGIPGCVFVHAGGFIGGNATYEGALAMAQKSLVLE